MGEGTLLIYSLFRKNMPDDATKKIIRLAKEMNKDMLHMEWNM